MKNKLFIGQTVYLRPKKMGDAYRRNPNVVTSKIIKIGRKYVEVEKYGKFEILTGRQKIQYSADYVLFYSESSLNLTIEKEELEGRIRNSIPTLHTWDISIEKLRQIAEILNC